MDFECILFVSCGAVAQGALLFFFFLVTKRTWGVLVRISEHVLTKDGLNSPSLPSANHHHHHRHPNQLTANFARTLSI